MRTTSPLRGLPSPQRTLPGLLELQAERWPERTLVRTPELTLTVGELRDRAARMAGLLSAVGIRRGDAVATLSENRVELLDLWLGCAWMGALYVPVNAASRGPQLVHVLSDVSARLLIAESRFLADLEAIRGDLGKLENLWRFEDLPAAAGPVPPVAARPGDSCTILYTSGTTGPSKGVLCPHGQWYWWGVVTSELLGVTADDVLYTCLPLFHTNALNTFVQALVSGATFSPGPRFSASRFWTRLVEADATVTYIMGAMVHILSKQPTDPQERAHGVRVALAPATPAALARSFRERFGVELIDGWGSTESNCVISATNPATPPGSMGSVMPDFEARVVDEDDEELPPGNVGELVVRSLQPYAFSNGYHGLPEKTLEAWRNLWLHTGDRVVRDAAGWFWFIDRLKDSIRRRGENISSYEVEAALAAHPDVTAVAVVPVPSELGEDEVLAFVVPREGASLDPVDLIRHCEPLLAYFAIPRYVEIVDALPLTAGGKVVKYRLRERGVTDSTWDREAEGGRLTQRP